VDPSSGRFGKNESNRLDCNLLIIDETSMVDVVMMHSLLKAVSLGAGLVLVWMNALSLNLYDEEKRGKIESLQWKLAQELLALGLIVIIEWGTWGRSERDTLRLGARALGAAVELHYLDVPAAVLFDRIERRGMEDPPINPEVLSRWLETLG